MFKSIVFFYHILGIYPVNKWQNETMFLGITSFYDILHVKIVLSYILLFLYRASQTKFVVLRVYRISRMNRKREIVLLPKIRLWSGGSSRRVNILFLVVSVRKLSLKLVFWQFRFLRKDFDRCFSSGTKSGPFMGLSIPFMGSPNPLEDDGY